MSVTIIIPIHNSEKYLDACIESALNQSFQEIEVLCIDGGSTDNSFKIIDKWRRNDERVKYIYDADTSYGHKINIGIDKANGKYIAILESDDLMSTDMIEKLYIAAEEYGADIVDSDYYEMFNFRDRKYLNVIKKYSVSGDFPVTDYKGIWSALYKREFILCHHIRLNETPGASYQDTSFIFLACHLANVFYHLDTPFYQYRVDNVGSSVKNDRKITEIIGEYKFLRDEMIKKGIQEHTRWELYYIRKYKAYYWNYCRLSAKSRIIFLEKYIQELKEDVKNGNLDRNCCKGDIYKCTFRLIDDKESFIDEALLSDEKISIIHIVDFLEELEKVKDMKLVIFGAGVWGTKIISILLQGEYKLCAVCDNSVSLQGEAKDGFKVRSVEETVKLFPEAVYLVINRRGGKEMKEQLLGLGIIEQNIFIFK